MGYNPNVHHRRSIRLRNYDYSQAGLYFVTICVQDHVCLFGEIVNDEMVLNAEGVIVEECWMAIPEHFPNAVLHEHVVMQNHVHGIVELKRDIVGAENLIGAENFLPLQANRNEFQKMTPRSIGSIVKGFKIGVTKRTKYVFQISIWQRNYYEHIIRNDESYQKISNYIINNPKNWKDDKFYRD